MGSRGGSRQWTRWLHCVSRWAWDSEASNSTSRSGVWTPTLPGALISRHAIRTAPSDEARRYVCPTSRQARLYCDCFEQCRRALDALFASSRRMKKLSEPPTDEILELTIEKQWRKRVGVEDLRVLQAKAFPLESLATFA